MCDSDTNGFQLVNIPCVFGAVLTEIKTLQALSQWIADFILADINYVHVPVAMCKNALGFMM